MRNKTATAAGHPVTHAELGELLASLRFGIGASDLHGSLTGYLCGGGVADKRSWLAALELDAERAADTRQSQHVFAQLYEQCAAGLDDPADGFEPLLPPADAPLERRAESLVEWCRGFLGGIGLAGVSRRHGLSDDGAEILKDFGTIASTHFEYADDEEDETALTEVIEFIRVGVLLLHAEIARTPRGGATLH
ncbi:MAG TPA: UPF0149 family protein [Rudaea sp.]|nr:UPF0149 family protein [Rudaea sp.]